MNKLPKFKDLPAPNQYFDRLPDQLVARAFSQKSTPWKTYAAAAAVVLSLGFGWQTGFFLPSEQPLSADEEAILYIDSQMWTAEDVLTLSDDPNALLDQIISEEMPVSDDLLLENDLTWF